MLEPGVAVIAKAGAADADRLSRTTCISSTGNAKVSMLPITALFNVNIAVLISPSKFSPFNVSEPVSFTVYVDPCNCPPIIVEPSGLNTSPNVIFS